MIKCENLSREQLRWIGAQVSGAFLGEPGCFSVLPRDVGDKLFTLIVETCYETGHLYTTGENMEGFCVYWTKAERPGLLPQLKMAVRMALCLPLKLGKLMKDGQSNWTPTEKRYKKAPDFVEVFLLAVRKDCQGQGHFRAMLAEPFALAKERGTICVLDTDSEVKAAKYAHVGMRMIDRKPQRSGIEMFAMEL